LKRVLDDHLAAAQQALVTDGERTALVV
jgi:hypothetical protein